MKPTIHIIHGFICSGKTTFAEKLAKEKNAIIFSFDEWMVKIFGPKHSDLEGFKYGSKIQDLISSVYRRILELGIDVILDDGFWLRSDRDRIRRYAIENGFDCILYSINCPEKILIQRLRNRNARQSDDSVYISESKFMNSKQHFEPLGQDEESIHINTNT